jgi:hypothetical protein
VFPVPVSLQDLLHVLGMRPLADVNVLIIKVTKIAFLSLDFKTRVHHSSYSEQMRPLNKQLGK